MVREYFYIALTADSEDLREASFAFMFEGLGHQMHLIQDMGAAEHVRDDSHFYTMVSNYGINGYFQFENWAKERIADTNIVGQLAETPVYPALSLDNQIIYDGLPLSPISDLYDWNVYTGSNPSSSAYQGLAEFTSSNFFSDDTINMLKANPVELPYPRRQSTNLDDLLGGTLAPILTQAEDGKDGYSFYISKVADGETVEQFLLASYLTKYFATPTPAGLVTLVDESFYRDEQCHEDYVKSVVPRVVGYSAALLDYFFRGTLAIERPGSGVYALTGGTHASSNSFTKINAKVRNTTLNIDGSHETLTGGTIVAIARYKPQPWDTSPNLSNDPHMIVNSTTGKFDVQPPTLGGIKTNGSIIITNSTGSETGAVFYSEALMNAAAATPYVYAVSAPAAVGNMLYDTTTAVSFDFSASPIPVDITDLELQVVYKGGIGGELETGVAIGRKDLSEPTHHVFWNMTDYYTFSDAFVNSTGRGDYIYNGAGEYALYTGDGNDYVGSLYNSSGSSTVYTSLSGPSYGVYNSATYVLDGPGGQYLADTDAFDLSSYSGDRYSIFDGLTYNIHLNGATGADFEADTYDKLQSGLWSVFVYNAVNFADMGAPAPGTVSTEIGFMSAVALVDPDGEDIAAVAYAEGIPPGDFFRLISISDNDPVNNYLVIRSVVDTGNDQYATGSTEFFIPSRSFEGMYYPYAREFMGVRQHYKHQTVMCYPMIAAHASDTLCPFPEDGTDERIAPGTERDVTIQIW